MQIDAHHHFWEVSRGDYDWLRPELVALYRDFSTADLKPLLEAAGITCTIVVQAAPTLAETRYLLDIARTEPTIAGVVGWVPLLDAAAPTLLEQLAAEPKFKGVRPMLQDISQDDWICDPGLMPAIDALVAHNLTFDALVTPRHLPYLCEFAERYPQLQIVIDHGAKPAIRDGATGCQHWADRIATAARLPNVFCKLSGLVTEAAPGWDDDTLMPYVTHLIKQFGAGRLMWGSDWPVLNLNANYANWRDAAKRLTASLDVLERAALFGGTARAFYRI